MSILHLNGTCEVDADFVKNGSWSDSFDGKLFNSGRSRSCSNLATGDASSSDQLLATMYVVTNRRLPRDAISSVQ